LDIHYYKVSILYVKHNDLNKINSPNVHSNSISIYVEYILKEIFYDKIHL